MAKRKRSSSKKGKRVSASPSIQKKMVGDLGYNPFGGKSNTFFGTQNINA